MCNHIHIISPSQSISVDLKKKVGIRSKNLQKGVKSKFRGVLTPGILWYSVTIESPNQRNSLVAILDLSCVYNYIHIINPSPTALSCHIS